MSYQLQRENIASGVHLCSIRDTKFKHNRISVNMILPLERDKVTDRAVVPYILRKGYKDCPDFTKLNEKLENLYGASLDADVEKLGNMQILSVSIYGIDNRFALDGEDMIGECAELLCNIVLSPHFVDGVFLSEDVAVEKQYIIDTIQAEINDKRSYAMTKCIQIMCKGEQLAIRKYGYEEDAQNITPQSAASAYKAMIESSQIEIMFVGAGDSTAAKEIFTKAFGEIKRNPVQLNKVEKKQANDLKDITETMEVNQSKLVMGFRGGELGGTKELGEMRMMTALFGGTAFSLLFKNVREKLGLCYYCAARFDRFTGILTVDSGVEGHNRPKAQEEILRQLDLVKNGDFEDSDLENTKLSIITSLKYTTDSLGGIESWFLSQILGGTNVSPEDEIIAVRKITREDIVRAAQKMKLDTIYFLTGNEGK